MYDKIIIIVKIYFKKIEGKINILKNITPRGMFGGKQWIILLSKVLRME
jgi:hypothetical protein